MHNVESVMESIAHSDAQWKITRGVVTDKNMYMQFKSEFAVTEPAVGDRMVLGLNISNSETGKGSIVISQMMFTLACLNGAQTGQSLNRIRRPHLGKARGWEPESYNTCDKILLMLTIMQQDLRYVIKCHT